ncbi:SAM-dependent methyltransferase [Actinomadura scrupuli]|uniref:SAM-dependent methyltransferase n=1 Tax=Actinomadura scrupuli TaxID=559629 RepID=UPI003D9910FB
MTDEARRPADLDTTAPNLARMTDYFLGGKDNFAADRKAAEEVLAVAPEILTMARAGHAFQIRLVRYLAAEGITQFVNVGSGLPTQSNTHEVARSVRPDARVVYVDKDPVVLSHAHAILGRDPLTRVVAGDVLHPDELLADPELRGLIDFDRPLAILIFGALQYIPAVDDPLGCVARLRDAMPSGSYLGLSHVVFDARPDVAQPIVDIYRHILNRTEDASRDREQVLRFFDGLELVEPGLVYVREWRPDNLLAARLPEQAWSVGGVARKP